MGLDTELTFSLRYGTYFYTSLSYGTYFSLSYGTYFYTPPHGSLVTELTLSYAPKWNPVVETRKFLCS